MSIKVNTVIRGSAIAIIASSLWSCTSNTNNPAGPNGPSSELRQDIEANNDEKSSSETTDHLELEVVTAVKRPDFSYDFLISGENLGLLLDAQMVQVEIGGATKKLIEQGQIKTDVELTKLELDGDDLYFNWKYPGAPTDRDRVQIDYILKGSTLRESKVLRLIVPFDEV